MCPLHICCTKQGLIAQQVTTSPVASQKDEKSAFFFREQSILDMLRLDLNYALRNEIMYWGESGPPDVPKVEDLTPTELKKLDRIAELLKHAGSHTDELQHLKNSIEFLRK